MYGGSGKLGRGGGGGRGGAAAGKRINPHSAFHHHPPPIHRPSAAPAGRLSVGGAAAAAPRNRGAMTSGRGTSAPSGVEETFSLVTGNPLDFAMIIRLAPDLVDEIKRVEAQGGTARIKFDSNANNPSGNVIDVGGKDFRFTWSHETRDLCDIYEERQSGEDGNGLLVESGCAWRKLNVQRILDESTKNHVKKRSEEAERQQKSRKAIILEHGNPTKSQIKALAAAEANPWRKPFMKKEPEFKKRKVETHTVTTGGPPKAAYKSSLPATTPAKGRPSISPRPSPPEHTGAPASPLGTGNQAKGHTGIEEVMPIQANTKENNANSEKEMPNRATSGAARVKPGSRGNLGAKPTDLMSMLILLLKENPKGMSVKALEKAIGDKIPNSMKKIEPIIKKIATFQAPGRYILKQGVELEHLKKPLSESGSSPEYDRHRTPAPENKQDDAPAAVQNFEEKVPTKKFDKPAALNSKLGEQKSPEKVDTQNRSPDIFGDKKASDNSEGPAGSSNDSGSDSDSESDSSDSGSDSGSHSRSRSKSRSPVESRSASSSDSETDASSNSKQGPDEDVDIMTSDDDKELKPKSEPGFSVSPIPWRTSASGPVQNGIDEKQVANSSDVVEIEKDSPDDVQQTETAVLPNLISDREGEKPSRDMRPFSPGNQERPESQVYTGILFGESESTAKDGFNHEETGSSERLSRGKSKRRSDSVRHLEKLDRAKRLKAGNLPQPKAFPGRDSFFSVSPQRLSPDRVIEDPYRGNSTQMINKTSRDGNDDSDILKGCNQGSFGKPSLDYQNSGRRPVDVIARVRATESAERPGIHTENLGYGHGVTERNRHLNDGLPIQKDKICSEIQDENCYTKEKNMPRNSKEGSFAETHSTYLDSSYYGKHGETPGGKLKEAGEVSNSCMGYSLKDNEKIDVERSPVLNGRRKMLQRELSDLELGELREPWLEETPGFKKEFERKSSFKHSENRASSLDYCNIDTSNGKLTGKASVDSKKSSPPHSRVGIPNNPEGLSKKSPEHHSEDINRLQHSRVGKSQSQAQQYLSRVDRELDTYKLADMSGKLRQNEARVSLGTGIEGYGDTNRKASSSAPQQYDTKRGPISHPMKESRTQKSNMLAELSDTRKDTSLTESNEGNLKRRESSSDENSCSYSKYEKEEPELKGPIKDINQYDEYVQEFCEKYGSYCSLYKILEGYRIEFEKLGKDLEIARERDMEKYYNIVSQLKESYRQCGARHKRLKRIFSVLHEELKHMKEMMKDFANLYSRD